MVTTGTYVHASSEYLMITNFKIGNNNRVYFHDTDTKLWELSGRFTHAVTIDDPISWSVNKDNGQYELHMMDISILFIYFLFVLAKFY